MTLKLTCKAQARTPVEIEGLTPDVIRTQSLSEIERFGIFVGNQQVPLAELFGVAGDPASGRLELAGNLSVVHWIGAHMQAGEVHVQGPAGRHLGSQMRGGEIHVHGDAGDWVGGEMRGGCIRVHGAAGHLVGAAYRGSRRGMTGGTILIDGNAGSEVGHTMRRGLIVVGGATGDMLAFHMLAGSVLVFGDCGIRPGAGMRRGTLALLGTAAPVLLPTFRYACTYQPLVLPLLLRHVRDHGFAVDPSLLAAKFDLYHGDMIEQGRGEILVRCPSGDSC
ncbi:MAG: formylmethanofuran dehydrogenase subunit C [Planctomycetes bacterium RBG_16_64_10]|nr:MAG: formylmethanofuran dehydrogenase subunit C [Planctomycetes bacterium RBG_16_64_10]